MGSFFQQTAQTIITINGFDRFPLLKINQIINWQPIHTYLEQQKNHCIPDRRGCSAYSYPPMFKAVLTGRWHSLSVPELEHSLITRIVPNLFCGFDEPDIPDHSTLCRCRLAQDQTLPYPSEPINRQRLKVEKAAAVIAAAIIQTAGGKQRQTIETDEKVSPAKPPRQRQRRPSDKKDGKFKPAVNNIPVPAKKAIPASPANEHERRHFDGTAEYTAVYAGKGCGSKANRE